MKKLINLFRQCFGNPINNNKFTPKYERKSFDGKDLKGFNQNTRLYEEKIKEDIKSGLIISGSFVPTNPTGYYFCSGLIENKSN